MEAVWSRGPSLGRWGGWVRHDDCSLSRGQWKETAAPAEESKQYKISKYRATGHLSHNYYLHFGNIVGDVEFFKLDEHSNR